MLVPVSDRTNILSALGAGGMGEVYFGIDTVLGRHVAIKVLPESFDTDSDRLARFERIAKALAALNHPGIAQIDGLERSGMTGGPRDGAGRRRDACGAYRAR